MTTLLQAQPSILDQDINLKHFSNFPSRLVAARDVDVFLPPGYKSNPKKEYAVLVIQDGQNLFSATTAYGGKEWKVDETLNQMTTNQKIEPCIVVGVWNAGDKRFQNTYHKNRWKHYLIA